MTIVTQYVLIYALPHLDSHFKWAGSAGMFQKRNPVCWQRGGPWGTGGFCDVQFQPRSSYGTTGPWGVQRETDHGWKTVGIRGDHGGTEQINPGDYCQTACSSGFRMVKMGSGLTWTCFSWAQPPAKGGDAQCRRHNCWFKWMAFICKGIDLLFHFMW